MPMIFFAPKDTFTEKEFKFFFDKYYRQITNYIYYKSGNIELSEDIVQETFLTIWNKRDEIDKSTISSFLYKIAGNLFLNEIKHRKVVSNYEFLYKTDDYTNQNPEYLLEEKEFKEKLFGVINSIPEKNRTVFLMNRIDKLTYAQIAERLDISPKAVEKRMQKALLVMREISDKI